MRPCLHVDSWKPRCLWKNCIMICLTHFRLSTLAWLLLYKNCLKCWRLEEFCCVEQCVQINCGILNYSCPSGSARESNPVLFHCVAPSPGFTSPILGQGPTVSAEYTTFSYSHLRVNQRELQAAGELYYCHNSRLIPQLAFWFWQKNWNYETLYPAPQSHMRFMNLQLPSENPVLWLRLPTRRITINDPVISD